MELFKRYRIQDTGDYRTKFYKNGIFQDKN